MPRRRVHVSQPFSNPGRVLKPAHGREKPKKPSDDYPLFPHTNGCWAKKIRGRVHYFGSWVSSDTSADHGAAAALAKYLQEKDDLFAGRTPRPKPAAATVKDVCNDYLNVKQARVGSGELSPKTWREGKEACDLIVDEFGKQRLVSDLRPDDFVRLRATMAKRWGPVRLGNVIHRVKSVFKHALESGLIDRPVLYGPDFRKPSAGVLRRHRAQGGGRMLEAGQVRGLLDLAGTQMKAMILLGVNCGFGNTDCAALPLSALDLDRAVIDFPRPKTGIPRRCPLWPETVEALRAVLAERPAPKAGGEALALLSERGSPLVVTTEKGFVKDCVTHAFKSLLKRAGLHRRGVGFYSLRHVHRTVSDEARDPVACDLIMGHSDPSMAGHYRERISDARLKAVADHVRAWLFGGGE